MSCPVSQRTGSPFFQLYWTGPCAVTSHPRIGGSRAPVPHPETCGHHEWSLLPDYERSTVNLRLRVVIWMYTGQGPGGFSSLFWLACWQASCWQPPSYWHIQSLPRMQAGSGMRRQRSYALSSLGSRTWTILCILILHLFLQVWKVSLLSPKYEWVRELTAHLRSKESELILRCPEPSQKGNIWHLHY